MWNLWALHEDKRVLTEHSFHHLCIPPPLPYSFSMLLCDNALQQNDSSFCACDPIFEYFCLACLEEMFFGSEVKKMPTALIRGSRFVAYQTPKATGWEPHPELTEEVVKHTRSSLSHLFTKAYSKQEMETRIWFRAEMNRSCSSRPCLCELVRGWFWM